MENEPAYLALHRSGELKQRARMALARLEECDLCPRRCRVDRRTTRDGAGCRTGEHAVVYSYGSHHGEEDPLRGWGGSGTIFFSWCSLRCVYCQNWEISQRGSGGEVGPRQLAEMMLRLQSQGCHNINLVTPSHVIPQILAAVSGAADAGLRLPLVYNTGGYDSTETLRLLDGIIDIYMPDMKYGDDETAFRLSGIKGYVEVNRSAVREMHRQVGDLVLDDSGVAARGLLIRHLVLPAGLAGTEQVLSFVAREISTGTYVNLMAQYRPCYRAGEFPALSEALSREEYGKAVRLLSALGLRRFDRRPGVIA
jgi:putative pyruvate formate lyase activating enzyme